MKTLTLFALLVVSTVSAQQVFLPISKCDCMHEWSQCFFMGYTGIVRAAENATTFTLAVNHDAIPSQNSVKVQLSNIAPVGTIVEVEIMYFQNSKKGMENVYCKDSTCEYLITADNFPIFTTISAPVDTVFSLTVFLGNKPYDDVCDNTNPDQQSSSESNSGSESSSQFSESSNQYSSESESSGQYSESSSQYNSESESGGQSSSSESSGQYSSSESSGQYSSSQSQSGSYSWSSWSSSSWGSSSSNWALSSSRVIRVRIPFAVILAAFVALIVLGVYVFRAMSHRRRRVPQVDQELYPAFQQNGIVFVQVPQHAI